MNIIKYNDYTTVIKISFAELDKIDMALCDQPKQTLEKYYEACERKPDILINGGFFNSSNGDTCFNYIDEYETIASTNLHQWGMGITGDKGLSYGARDAVKWRDFISGYPNLIDNYQKVDTSYANELNYKAKRTILAYDLTNVYIIAVDPPGMNFSAMQDMLMDLKVQFAINLDGGGSTRILNKGELLVGSSYSRPVDNVIAFYLTEKKIYCIQIGAFSIKENAEKLLAELKEKGYNGFITTK